MDKNHDANYFWVNQGSSFRKELNDGILCSPQRDKRGSDKYKLMRDLHIGDIIINYKKPEIVAFSEVLEEAYINENDDYEVKLKYTLLDKPIKKEEFKKRLGSIEKVQQILSNINNIPFDKNFNVNLGYLFNINKEIFDLIFNNNPILSLKWWEIAAIAMYKEDPNREYKPAEVLKLEFVKKSIELKNVKNPSIATELRECSDDISSNYKRKNRNYFLRNGEFYKLSEEGKNYIQKNLRLFINNNNYKLNHSKNIILYGPPGTGKTYNTVIKAMEIINDKKYDSVDVELYKDLKKQFDNLKKQGQIEFVTFHQSYSYEEFVEGIKPYIPEWGTVEENNRFIGQDGIFKKICNSAKTTIEGNFEKIYSQFIEEIDENYEFKTKKGSFKIRVNDNDGLTIRTGDNFEKETCGTITKEQIKNQTFTSLGRKQKLEAITKYLKEKYGLTFSSSIAVKPHILIIDEINRGDVSKIFGELITLIEEDKRICKEHQMTVTLPYSRETFGVPDNLYIIGTMNTADRSIALLDTALRRRFDFEEMMPKPEKIVDENKQPQMVEDINLQNLLKNINKRISHILDRDHQIGHSYLMGVKNKEQLERAYKNRILPLLNEYFYNDIDSVAKILNCKPNDVSSKENWFNVLKEAQKSTKKDNEQ